MTRTRIGVLASLTTVALLLGCSKGETTGPSTPTPTPTTGSLSGSLADYGDLLYTSWSYNVSVCTSYGGCTMAATDTLTFSFSSLPVGPMSLTITPSGNAMDPLPPFLPRVISGINIVGGRNTSVGALRLTEAYLTYNVVLDTRAATTQSHDQCMSGGGNGCNGGFINFYLNAGIELPDYGDTGSVVLGFAAIPPDSAGPDVVLYGGYLNQDYANLMQVYAGATTNGPWTLSSGVSCGGACSGNYYDIGASAPTNPRYLLIRRNGSSSDTTSVHLLTVRLLHS